jgi:FMN phosphatase YigB (HAD superfamily)
MSRSQVGVCMSGKTSSPPVRALIFDVDGTLYRQAPVRAGMLLRLISHCLGAPFDGFRTVRFLREYRRLQEELRAGASAGDQLPSACARLRVDPEWAGECVEKWMHRYPLDLIRKAIYADVTPFLIKAKKRGLRLGVFSDYPAAQKLQAMGIAHYFSSILSAGDARAGVFKPDPRGILAVASDLEVPPGETIYIGDRREIDALAAENAGMRCFILHARQLPGSPWTGVRNYAAMARLLGL